MKKTVRILAVILCIAMLAVSLCSCKMLDEKKENHAIFTDDTYETIEFRGNTYKKVKLPKDVSIITDYYNSSQNSYVTTKDVPVLLSSMYGQPFSYDTKEKNPIVIQCYKRIDYSYIGNDVNRWLVNSYSNDADFGIQDSEKCYVREDRYEELNKEFENPKLDHYYYYDYSYDNGTPYNGNDSYYSENGEYYAPSYECRLVNEELTKVINDSSKNGKKIDYKKLKDEGWTTFALNYCDQNLLLTDDSKRLYIFCDDTGKKYYLVPVNCAFGIAVQMTEVPEKYKGMFDQLFSEQADDVINDDHLYQYFKSDEMQAEDYGEGDSSKLYFGK